MEKRGQEDQEKEEEEEDMTLASTLYIAAIFAIFTGLLSYILSCYGSQVDYSPSHLAAPSNGSHQVTPHLLLLLLLPLFNQTKPR